MTGFSGNFVNDLTSEVNLQKLFHEILLFSHLVRKFSRIHEIYKIC